MTQPRPREQRAYDVLSTILQAQVTHYDDNRGPSTYDGLLRYPDGREAAIEVTAPPAHKELRKAAITESKGGRHLFGGHQPVDLHLNHFRDWLQEQIQGSWFAPNAAKLVASGLDERHLVLDLLDSPGLGHQLSIMDATGLPDHGLDIDPVTDLWIFGFGPFVIRYSQQHGWIRYEVPITDDDISRYRRLSSPTSTGGEP